MAPPAAGLLLPVPLRDEDIAPLPAGFRICIGLIPVRTDISAGAVVAREGRGGRCCSPVFWPFMMGSCILRPAIAEFSAASVDSVCCFLGAVAFGIVGLTGCEFGRVARCSRSGDFSGTGGGGVSGGGEAGPTFSGGLGSGGGLEMLARGLGTGLGCCGKAPGIGGGAWKGSGVAGLALRNELVASDSGVRARGNESDVDDRGGLRNISPEGLAGRFGGGGLPLEACPVPLPLLFIESTKLPASLPAPRLGGPGGGGGGGSKVVGKLVLLPPSPIDFPFPLLGILLIFHASLSVSRISSTSLLFEKRLFFFFFSSCLESCESVFCNSFTLPILVPPLARFA